MTAQCPINAAAVDTLGQYQQATRHLIAAYRVGTTRAVDGAGERYARIVGRPSFVGNDVKKRLIDAEQKAGRFVVGVVDGIAGRADGLVDGLAQRAVAGLELLDRKTAWSRESSLINALRRLNLPAAKASVAVAQRVADASRRLSERVAGEPVVVSATKKVAKTAAKKARAGAAATRRAVRKSA